MAITNINNKDQINQSASLASSSTSNTGAAKSDNVSIIETKKPKEEILKQLGITAEQYLEICTNNPSFETLSLEQQLEYISKTNSKNIAENQNQQDSTTTAAAANSASEKVSNQNSNAGKEPSGLFFDKASFSKESKSQEDVNQKINTYIQEYAKNKFMFAEENNAKSQEDWDALSDEEKAKYVKNAESFLNGKFGDILKDLSIKEFDLAIDGMMTNLLAANQISMDIEHFNKADKILREDAVYSYLNEVDLVESDMKTGSSLSDLDRERLRQERLLADAVSFVSGRDDLCPIDAKRYLSDNNITEYEVLYTFLNKKKESGEKLSNLEESQLKELTSMMSSETFKQLLKETKFQGLNQLKQEREKALAEGKTHRVEEIDKVLQSPESKLIEQWAANRDEKPVENTKEYEEFKNSKLGQLYSDLPSSNSKERAVLIMAYLEKKVPPEKRNEVFAKIVQGVYAEGPQNLDLHIKLLEIGLQSEKYADSIVDNANLTTLNVANNNNVRARRKVVLSAQRKLNKYNLEKAKNAQTEEERIEQRKIIREAISVQKDYGTDKSKDATINDYAELSSDDEIGIELNETNISITDKRMQRDNIAKINANASEKVKIHGAENSYRLLEGNQAYGLDVYTKGSQAATEAAAKAGVYSKFAESEQIEGFKITNQRIEELFKGQEKIDLLKTTSDFIENCAIENQKDLYDMALNSGYSEVSDYVSSKMESSNKEVLNIVSNLNSDYKSVTGKDIEVYNNEGDVSNIVSEFRIAMEQNDTQRQIQLLGKIPSNMLSSAISKISMYNVNLLATFVRLGRGNELLKIPGMSSDVTNKVIHLMLNSSLKDQKVAAKYVVENKNYFSKSTLERCQELLQDNKNTYTSAPMGGVKSALQPSMSAIYPGKKQMFYKA